MSYGRVGYSRIVGYDNIVGGPDGGAAHGQQQYRRALRGAGVGVPMGGFAGGPQSVQEGGGSMRFFPMGFFQAAVGKSTGANILEKPQVIFRGERLILPTVVDTLTINPFNLTGVLVGQRSQFVSTTSLFGGAFSADAVGVALELDTASIGQDITIQVLNTDSAATHDFQAVLLGTACLPPG